MVRKKSYDTRQPFGTRLVTDQQPTAECNSGILVTSGCQWLPPFNFFHVVGRRSVFTHVLVDPICSLKM